jgi:hypothetical protein
MTRSEWYVDTGFLEEDLFYCAACGSLYDTEEAADKCPHTKECFNRYMGILPIDNEE